MYHCNMQKHRLHLLRYMLLLCTMTVSCQIRMWLGQYHQKRSIISAIKLQYSKNTFVCSLKEHGEIAQFSQRSLKVSSYRNMRLDISWGPLCALSVYKPRVVHLRVQWKYLIMRTMLRHSSRSGKHSGQH